MPLIKHNISQWIQENKADFKPPVCNKSLYNGQIKAFLVGGPNIRKDFHLEEGEEFFYMIEGDMCLRSVEDGKIKDIRINQGQVYMQPGRVLHSPQRYPNTVGLVVERSRASNEMDCLRYFADESTLEVLFERWLHLKDAVADLPPIIKEFFDSEACKCGRPTKDSIVSPRPYEADPNIHLDKPFSLNEWLDTNADELKKYGKKQLFGPPRFKSTIMVYGHGGSHKVQAKKGETLLWFFKGTGQVSIQQEHYSLKAVETLLIPNSQSFTIENDDNSFCFTINMPTPSENHDKSKNE